MSTKKYVQYGCGLSAPKEWVNFDSSPTLRVQKTPLLGFLLKKGLNTVFPDNIKLGDIVKGLPVEDQSCDAVYCSHVLEHLSLADFRTALKNTYRILKPGGTFRLVMPDLEYQIGSYVANSNRKDPDAAIKFMRNTFMAFEERPRGSRALLEAIFGNARHLWLWDKASTISELTKVGFKNMRECKFNDSADKMFLQVEDEERFQGAVALEMSK